jgi:predicted ABC-type ATPase
MPEVYIIAGANGSGKSTISKSIVTKINIPIIDPDAIAREINPLDPKSEAIAAGKTAINRAQKYINESVSFGVETTLSGKSYLKLMLSL